MPAPESLALFGERPQKRRELECGSQNGAASNGEGRWSDVREGTARNDCGTRRDALSVSQEEGVALDMERVRRASSMSLRFLALAVF
jgi:hypothetical protein